MQGVVISELERACLEHDRVSRAYRDDSWLVYDYRTGEFGGQVLYCGPFQDLPALTIRLDRRGWHRIHLGIHYGMAAWPLETRMQMAGAGVSSMYKLRVRLTRDGWWDLVDPETASTRQQDYFTPDPGTAPARTLSWYSVDEVFWRAAELDGQALHIAPFREPLYDWSSAALAWVRLVPMDEADVRELEREKARAETRRVMAVYDGTDPPRDEAEVRTWTEPLRDSDVEVLCWCASALDKCLFPTRVGEHVGDLFHVGSVSRRRPLVDPAFDPLKTAAERCRELGIVCLASMRAAGGRIPPSHLPPGGPSFFWQHPEWWCRTERGEAAGHLSLAFPEVRARQIGILEDCFTGRDIDGVHYHFNRCHPFVAYEEPVVEAFRARHGLDPRSLTWDDERFVELRCDLVTGFLRELRAALDTIGARRGRRAAVGLTVLNSLENCRIAGCDLASWLAEGLVDYLMVHPGFAPDRRGEYRVTAESVLPIQRLAERAGRGCKVYADLYPRYMPAEHYRQQALRFYRAGVYGLALWDYYTRTPRKSEWAMCRLLGHRQELEGWREKALSFGASEPLVSLAGMSVDPRYTPGTNG